MPHWRNNPCCQINKYHDHIQRIMIIKIILLLIFVCSCCAPLIRDESWLCILPLTVAESQPSKPRTIPSPNLPSGWEKRLDPNTRRYYYINHNKGTTQWEAPVNQTGQCQNLNLSIKQVNVQLLVMVLLEFCSARI